MSNQGNLKGGPAAAGTIDTRVDRPEEGLAGVANLDNVSANPPSRASFDSGKATGYKRELPSGVIDTTRTSGLTDDAALKRGQPSAWV